MTNIFTKKIGSIFLLITFFTTTVTVENHWYSPFTQNSLAVVTVGITALIIGKISYNYYQAHHMTYEHFVENCRAHYKKIHQDTQHYYHLYRNDAQISDWELKEMIVENYKDPYPFIEYHTSLTKNIWLLRKYLLAINNQLKQIEDQQKQLMNSHKTEKNIHLEEMLLQLEIRGKSLQEYIIKTITLITILKKKIKLFKEYNDDCYNWSQAERKKDTLLLQC